MKTVSTLLAGSTCLWLLVLAQSASQPPLMGGCSVGVDTRHTVAIAMTHKEIDY